MQMEREEKMGGDKAVIALVERMLVQAKRKRATGTLSFEIGLRDGGITSRKAGYLFHDKNGDETGFEII